MRPTSPGSVTGNGPDSIDAGLCSGELWSCSCSATTEHRGYRARLHPAAGTSTVARRGRVLHSRDCAKTWRAATATPFATRQVVDVHEHCGRPRQLGCARRERRRRWLSPRSPTNAKCRRRRWARPQRAGASRPGGRRYHAADGRRGDPRHQRDIRRQSGHWDGVAQRACRNFAGPLGFRTPACFELRLRRGQRSLPASAGHCRHRQFTAKPTAGCRATTTARTLMPSCYTAPTSSFPTSGRRRTRSPGRAHRQAPPPAPTDGRRLRPHRALDERCRSGRLPVARGV